MGSLPSANSDEAFRTLSSNAQTLMPAQYDRIKESYLKRGKPPAMAKKLAAMTFNARRGPGVAPVGPQSDKKLKPPKRQHKYSRKFRP